MEENERKEEEIIIADTKKEMATHQLKLFKD